MFPGFLLDAGEDWSFFELIIDDPSGIFPRYAVFHLTSLFASFHLCFAALSQRVLAFVSSLMKNGKYTKTKSPDCLRAENAMAAERSFLYKCVKKKLRRWGAIK